jgi:glycosyltransferase involved in cell wall biosynthesis
MPPLKCGIGYYSSRLLSYFDDKNRITVLTSPEMGLESDKYTVKHVKSWHIRHLASTLKLIKSSKPDIISLQYPAKGYGRQLGINILPYIIRKTPISLTLHEYHGSPLLGRIRNLITALPVQKIIVSNPYDFQALPRFLQKKTLVIPIGSNIERVPANRSTFDDIVRDAGFNERKPIGVFFGFAFKSKGLNLLLSAVEKANSQLLILSELSEDNPFQKSILDRISALREKGVKVYCAGHLSDKKVSEAIRGCTYFVLPQRMPITAKSGTAIAASIHGVPVVSTGGDKKSLNLPYKHNENALLLNPMNLQTLSNTLKDISSDPELIERLASGARGLAEYFDWTSIASEHQALWRTLKDGK